MSLQRFLVRAFLMAVGTLAILIVVGEFDWRGPAALFYGLFVLFLIIDCVALLRSRKSGPVTS